jgi:hypothetical protein
MTLDDCKCAVCGSTDLVPMHVEYEDRARCRCCGCHMPVSMCKPKKTYAHKADYDAIERANAEAEARQAAIERTYAAQVGAPPGASIETSNGIVRQARIEAAAERFYNSLPGYRHVWSEASAVQQAAYIDAVRNLVDSWEGLQ